MILLSAHGIRKHFGPDPVLDGVTFDVRRGQRIALVGPNGAGKTTLLKILIGREDADAGDVQTSSSARIGYLEQQPDFDPSHTVWKEARSALAELIELASEAERLGSDISVERDLQRRARLEKRFDFLQHELERRDAYRLDHKIERVLAGLGFREAQYQQPVSELSGGQQNRLLLAKLLLEDADLLLLDEPSNHLDLDATQWLEDFLIETRQSLMVVSHDRYFLDKVTNQTFELFQGTVDSYSGNFSAYVRQKAERLEVQRRTHEKQQAEIAKMEDFVRRHSYGPVSYTHLTLPTTPYV
jgi:ATP-binding cassette subfamily F protein 3